MQQLRLKAFAVLTDVKEEILLSKPRLQALQMRTSLKKQIICLD